MKEIWYAMMIQHNDSDTSCMRAVTPVERTFASEAEHTYHSLSAVQGSLCCFLCCTCFDCHDNQRLAILVQQRGLCLRWVCHITFTVQESLLLHHADAEHMAELFVGARLVELVQSVRLRLV